MRVGLKVGWLGLACFLGIAALSWYLGRWTPVPRPTVTVRLLEGGDRFAVAELLAKHGVCDAPTFLALSAVPQQLGEARFPSAEGLLFPDTYRFYAPENCERVLKRLLHTFRRRALPLWRDRNRAQHPLLRGSLRRWVTLASIVEREAGPGELRRVAGVFQNRLLSPRFRPKRLQADATRSYLERWERVAGPLSEARRDAYDTYRREDLPLGPIGSPSLAALAASLSPEAHDFFYFVRDPAHRGHRFSEDLASHTVAVRAWRAFKRGKTPP